MLTWKKKKEMGGILLRHLWEQDMHGRNFSQLTDGAHYCEAEPAWNQSSCKAKEIGEG